jgi:tRNA A37 threonylcarbamoyladenosine synthetase subunit TsaC/SUA5/YrdC
MSVLVRGFSDIDAYTQGFPDNVVAGRTQPFKLARQCLPGPYTFILQAGKAMPKICLQDPSTKSKSCKVRVAMRVAFAYATCIRVGTRQPLVIPRHQIYLALN